MEKLETISAFNSGDSFGVIDSFWVLLKQYQFHFISNKFEYSMKQTYYCFLSDIFCYYMWVYRI